MKACVRAVKKKSLPVIKPGNDQTGVQGPVVYLTQGLNLSTADEVSLTLLLPSIFIL